MTTATPTMPSTIRDDDAGFTLIEVIVALVIMAIVATAALYFFVGGTRSVTNQQRSQNAVAVANDAMERAYGVQAKSVGTTDVSGLVAGRTQAAVDAAWAVASAAGVEALDQTYPVWDTSIPTTAPASGQAVATSSTVTHSKIPYTTTTIIGACYRPTATTTAPCEKVAGQANNPTTVPVGTTRVMRVLVLVTWPSVGGTCPADTCTYQVSSLIDPSSDLKWNNTTRPVAVDDVVSTDVNTPVLVQVLTNDVIGPVTMNPVFLLTPVDGAPTLTNVGDGTVRFTPQTNVSGTVRFTYQLKDGAGRQSNSAQVSVNIKPKAVADTASTSKDAPILIPVLANDQGSPGAITIDSAPTKGTASVESGGIRFNPNGQTGTSTFSYHYSNALMAGGQVDSNTVTVTVTISAFAAPVANDVTMTLVAANTDLPLDMTVTGNAPGYVYDVQNPSVGSGTLKIGGVAFNATSNRAGTDLAYRPGGNLIGTYTFKYRTQSPDGAWSGTVYPTATLKVVPSVQDLSYNVSASTNQKSVVTDIKVSDTTLPNSFSGGSAAVTFTVTSPSCGSLGTPSAGVVKFTSPKSKGTCTFTYTVTGTGSNASLASRVATVSVKVN